MKTTKSISCAEIIQYLWEIKSISINTKEPFKLASGRTSPIYIDCRKLISYPEVMDKIASLASEIISKKIGKKEIDVIAGGATAGIPFAAWVSQKTKIPMVYVRRDAKNYGKGAQVEGVLEQGKKVLLVEDLITSGESKNSFILGIKNAGCEVKHCLVVFDREQGGFESLAKQSVELHSMATLSSALDYGLEKGLITKEEFEAVKNYLKENK